MSGGRRVRRRASDLAAKQKSTSRSGIFIMGIGLLLIIAFKFAMGDESAEVFQAVVGSEQVDLPESVLDKRERGLIPATGGHPEGAKTSKMN